MHSPTEENYLKAIYRLGKMDENAKITPTTIAEAVRVNPASVIDMIKKLTEKQLIDYDKVNGAKLTDSGRRFALNIVRKHRLWEVFLFEKLGYSWDAVHDIAEQLEHIQNAELADRLEQFLGFPEYDPHGDPIPNAMGELPNMVNTLLCDVELGKTCRVAAVKDTSTVFLQYLQHLNISIGSTIKVRDKVIYDGSLSVEIADAAASMVSKKLAESLLVRVLD